METEIRDDKLKSKRKKKKKRRVLRFFLTLFSFIVIALAAFLITIKVVAPEFDIKALIPEKTYSLVSEKLFGVTTTTTTEPSVTEPTTEKKTTLPLGYYLPQKEFKNSDDKKGNLIGNLLNGGKAWHDASYIYHLVDGEGVYRLFPGDESTAKLCTQSGKLTCLNVSSKNLYFINDGKLKVMKKNASKPEKLAENIKFAYLYGETLYLVTTNNEIAKMNTEKKKLKIIRKVDCKDINFIGLSKDLMYFEVVFDEKTSYICIDKKGKKHAVDFRYQENNGDLLKPVMENGFMYYYKKTNGNYDLCRQKFGSDKVVTLVKNSSTYSYATVENNRLFFSELKNGLFRLKEINMNNEKTKTLLSVNNVSESTTLNISHGGTYDFVYGRKSESGDSVYSASCIRTSSSNVMSFKGGKWKY